jgi:hypothetical protein
MRGGALQLHRLSVSGMQLPLQELTMIHNFVARIARFALPLAIASATGMVGAQTITYSNSPGGYPGNVSYAGGAANLQTGTPIDLFDSSSFWGNNFNFSFQTGATGDGWTFAPGGTVSMVVRDGIDINHDFVIDIAAGTTIFTGVLGATTVHDRRGPPDTYGNQYESGPPYIGDDFDISASFSVSALHAGYAAALGVPSTGDYSGSFLLGVDSWDGRTTTQGVGWREVSLTLNQQTAPVPEPETYAMMLAGLGLLGVMTRRRKQKAVA